MGCWNKTCALSNLPIDYGEEVYVLFLVESKSDPYTNDHCHPNTYYSPLPFYFEGKYNDYGYVEDCKGIMLDHLVEYIRKNLVEFEEGENRYHDIAVKKNSFDLETLFRADHEGRLYIRDFTHPDLKPNQRVSHIQIKKCVLDDLMRSWYQTNDFIIEYIYKENSDVTNLFDRELLLVEKMLEATFPYYEKYKQSVFEEFFLECFGGSLYPSNKELSNFIRDMNVFRILPHRYPYYFQHDIAFLKDLLTNACLVKYLDQFMNTARKLWIVPCGVGSQNIDISAQQALARVILNQKEYNGEEDDD